MTESRGYLIRLFAVDSAALRCWLAEPGLDGVPLLCGRNQARVFPTMGAAIKVVEGILDCFEPAIEDLALEPFASYARDGSYRAGSLGAHE